MLPENQLTLKQRAKELLIDYLVIVGYLLVLLAVTLSFYLLVLKKIPDVNEWQSQLIATFTSVLPIILLFSFWDYHRGSLGKQKAGLKLSYTKKTFSASLIRNTIKFLPWQLGHISTIHGMYTEFDWLAILLTIVSTGLALVLLVMGILRKDKRHLGDLLAGTQVQQKN